MLVQQNIPGIASPDASRRSHLIEYEFHLESLRDLTRQSLNSTVGCMDQSPALLSLLEASSSSWS